VERLAARAGQLPSRERYTISFSRSSEPRLSDAHPHRHAVAAEPGFSLLRLSVAERLAGAGLIAGLLWLLVWWAL
jgi:hypothetical protein